MLKELIDAIIFHTNKSIYISPTFFKFTHKLIDKSNIRDFCIYLLSRILKIDSLSRSLSTGSLSRSAAHKIK